MMTRLVTLLVVCFALCPFAGCDEDGTGPYALWNHWSHPDGLFHFYYLSPPWTVHSESTDVHPVMVVHPYDEATCDGLGAAMRLEAFVSPADTAAGLSGRRRSEWQSAGYQLETAGYRNANGDEGLYFEGHAPEHKVVEVFYDTPHGAVAFSVWIHDVRLSADVMLLVAGFAPGAARGRQ